MPSIIAAGPGRRVEAVHFIYPRRARTQTNNPPGKTVRCKGCGGLLRLADRADPRRMCAACIEAFYGWKRFDGFDRLTTGRRAI